MISPVCFQREWILRHAEETGCRNPIMLEKAIVALQLLGYLVETGLPLQFKGGTSLLLRLPRIRRLSIDVDIVTQATPEELVAALGVVSKLPPFNGYEHDARRDKDLPPKKHFRVFYQSAVDVKLDHILLDALFEANEAPNCEPVTIATPFLTPQRDVRVLVPTVNYPNQVVDTSLQAQVETIRVRSGGVSVEVRQCFLGAPSCPNGHLTLKACGIQHRARISTIHRISR